MLKFKNAIVKSTLVGKKKIERRISRKFLRLADVVQRSLNDSAES